MRAISEDGASPLDVTVGLYDVVIEAIDTADNYFDATLWLLSSWRDPRLVRFRV